MLETAKAVVSDPFVIFFLTLLGLLLTYVFYRLGKAKVRLLFARDEASLISKARTSAFSDKLEIFYNSVKVPVITLSTVTVWNGGTNVLRREDLAPADPLKFVIGGENRILNVDVEMSRPVNRVVVDVDESGKTAAVAFDFLDPNEGFVCKIAHTAERGKINLTGTVMGAPRSPERVVDLRPIEMRFLGRVVRFNGVWLLGPFCLAIGGMFLAAALSPAVAQAINEPSWLKDLNDFVKQPWVNATLATPFLLLGMLILWSTWTQPARPRRLNRLTTEQR